MKSISLYTKINALPESLKNEVLDFVEFLLTRKNKIRKSSNRKAGFLKGKIQISPDFEKPLDDFKDYR
jgi:hypothetical protein